MANSDLRKFIRNLSTLEGKVKRSTVPAKTLSESLKKEMLDNMTVLQTATAEKGGLNDTGRVSVKAKSNEVTLKWTGDQIFYLEFGTGIQGDGRYKDESLMASKGYKHRPTASWRENGGTVWTLPEEYTDSNGERIKSDGWEPYAPFYKTKQAYLRGAMKPELEQAVRELVKSKL